METPTVECKDCGGTGYNRSFLGDGGDCGGCRGSGRRPMPLNPWVPIRDVMDLKHLGKLSEECGELTAAISRCIIQGVDQREPVTGKLNRDWLQDEIADVLANISLVESHFSLDSAAIRFRAARKIEHLTKWHAMTGEGDNGDR